jgi:hypothetical protein
LETTPWAKKLGIVAILQHEQSLHDPAGRGSSSFSALKTQLDHIQQILHANTGVENPNHILDAEPGLNACVGQLFNGSQKHWLSHPSASHCA